ncbi:ribosome hibernation-promoting factor, HPF/YfiA family [Candidatus Poriferisocius sp.]|uniref:ribosome hibernation-promoting factor, HPF/YfiA family n=1 Tax=Candidatus Poriferisocius sp. TaxID=3101276 RepID=UPI003B01C95C
MDIAISSSGVEVSQKLEEVTRTKVAKLDRYLSGIDRAEVRFSEERNPRIAEPLNCEVTLEGHGYHIRGGGHGVTAQAALDGAIDKLERQLRKEKTRRVNRQHNAGERRAG